MKPPKNTELFLEQKDLYREFTTEKFIWTEEVSVNLK